ncbi:MAG: hypothetical protein EXR71_03415 [Myxococcales bacterium]|nr:hypothetical protein [Myxococcales bacterium]
MSTEGVPDAPRVRWLVGTALAIALVALGKELAIDEESYRWLGRIVRFSDPYDWSRAWQGHDGWLYAHPPIFLWWARLWSPVESLPLARLSGLPWVALWAAASALWMRRTTHHPEVAAVAWLGSTTVVLGLQDTLMIDLPYVALSTLALAAYREGLADPRPRWMLLGGVALGAAIETKYPAALLVPVVALHAWRNRVAVGAYVGPAAAVVLTIEGWLYTQNQAWHPLAVWQSRELIAHGPLPGRVLGTLSRAALLPATAGLVYLRPAHAAVGVALGLAALAWARPPGLALGELLFLLAAAALGGAALSRGVGGLLASPLRRRKGDRGDGLLLGGTVVATFLGVFFLHNYASARYLLPAATPLAILLARAAEEVLHGKRVQLAVSALAGVLAAALALADAQYTAAGHAAALRAVDAARTTDTRPGRFLAEWSARAALETAGWRPLGAPAAAVSGETVIVLRNSGGRVPDSWEPLAAFPIDGLPLRVLDVDAQIGLYAETLGALPFGLSARPVETAIVYEVRP